MLPLPCVFSVGLPAAILLQAAGLLGGSGPAPVGSPPASWADEGDREEVPPEESPLPTAPNVSAVSLGELRAKPLPWLGQRVRFVIQFESLVDTWNPLLTRFGGADWIALSAWPDERFTWERSVFSDPMRRLFVRRGSALGELVGEYRPHERFEALGIVREVLLGEPWIELLSLRPQREIVGAGVILHVLRAEEAAAEGKWNLALDQVERALAGPLPAAPRAELETRQRLYRKRAGGALDPQRSPKSQ